MFVDAPLGSNQILIVIDLFFITIQTQISIGVVSLLIIQTCPWISPAFVYFPIDFTLLLCYNKSSVFLSSTWTTFLHARELIKLRNYFASKTLKWKIGKLPKVVAAYPFAWSTQIPINTWEISFDQVPAASRSSRGLMISLEARNFHRAIIIHRKLWCTARCVHVDALSFSFAMSSRFRTHWKWDHQRVLALTASMKCRVRSRTDRHNGEH